MPNTLSLRGRPRRRAVAHVRATHPNTCAICGHPIDMTADRQRHPLASSVDEWHPRHPANGSPGGSALDPANLRHLHRYCNGVKGNRPVTPEVIAKCKTHIAHLLGRPTTRTW